MTDGTTPAASTARLPAPERPGAQRWVPSGADLEGLRAASATCRGCELWEPASQVVFSAGAARGRVALVGEQPGDQEDRRGIPFVGPAGALLQRATQEAGLPREELYVTNAVKHFRFTGGQGGKRRIHQTPDAGHITACRPWLVAELSLLAPDLVVVLGATAAKALLGPTFRVTRERGRIFTRDTSAGSVDFLATVHPSSVLRTPPDQRDAAYQALVADLAVAAGALLGAGSRQGDSGDAVGRDPG